MKKNLNSKIYFDLINLCPTKLKNYVQNIGFLETYYLNNDFPIHTINQSINSPPSFTQICLSSNNQYLFPNIFNVLNNFSHDEKIRLSFLIENYTSSILDNVPINYLLKYIDILEPSHFKYIFKNRKAYEIMIIISQSDKKKIYRYLNILNPSIFFKILYIFDDNIDDLYNIELNLNQKNYMYQLCNQFQYGSSLDIKNFPLSFLFFIYSNNNTKTYFFDFFPYLSTFQKHNFCPILQPYDIIKIIKKEKYIESTNLYWINLNNFQKNKIKKYIKLKKKLLLKNNHLNIRNYKILILLSEKINTKFIIKKNLLKDIFFNLIVNSLELQNINKLQKLK